MHIYLGYVSWTAFFSVFFAYKHAYQISNKAWPKSAKQEFSWQNLLSRLASGKTFFKLITYNMNYTHSRYVLVGG